MTITEILAWEYESLFSPMHVYGDVPFTQLNADKAEDVDYLSFADGKVHFWYSYLDSYVLFSLLNYVILMIIFMTTTITVSIKKCLK